MKIKKFLALIAAIILSTAVFSGCRSTVALNYADGGDKLIYLLEVRLAADELALLNGSAAANHADYHLPDYKNFTTNWTVDEYIRSLIKYRTSFKYYAFEQSEDFAIYGFMLEVLKSDLPDDEDDEDSDKSTTTIESGFFMHKITVVESNPLSHYRAEYDDAKLSGSSTTAIEVLQNGLKTYSYAYSDDERQALLNSGYIATSDPNKFEMKYMPSFAEAFPIVKVHPSFNPDSLTLEYVLQTNLKLQTNDQVRYSISGNRAYVWQIAFDGKEYKLIYQYYRANTIGWNIVAILAGFAAMGIVLLYCHYKANKKPPKKSGLAAAKELFPYDPYSGDETNPYNR